MLEDLKDKEKELTKGMKSLTQAQKDLIEELRIVGKYQELDAVQQKKTMQEEQLVKIEEGFKEDKATYETIKHECKAIDFKFD